MFLTMKLNIYKCFYFYFILFYFHYFFHIYIERLFYTMQELDIKKK